MPKLPKVPKIPKIPKVAKNPPNLTFYTGPNALEAGIDESGAGPAFGPLFVGLVVLDKNNVYPQLLNDSKRLTPEKRKELRPWIEREAIFWHVESASVAEINECGILQANFRCMRSCVDALVENGPKVDAVVIDGVNSPYVSDRVLKTKSRPKSGQAVKGEPPLPVVTMVKGDSKNPCIAAASILAKEHHDDWIKGLVASDPTLEDQYGISSHMGYLTAKHTASILEHGPTKFHREAYLRKLLQTDQAGVRKIIESV